MSEHEHEQDEVLEQQPEEEAQPVMTGEVMPYAPPVANRTVDLRNVATDSWTDVLADVATLSRGICGTEFVPSGLRGSMEKTTAAILYGRELGLPPMTALGSIHVIDGKAGTSAESMRALILQAGHELEIREMSTSRCRIAGRRRGSESWTEAVATKAEFDQVRVRTRGGSMKLTEKDNWRNFPAEMLLARATTRLARMMFADVIHGMRSTEELSDMTEQAPVPAQGSGQSEPAQGPAAPGRTKVARKRRERQEQDVQGEAAGERRVPPPRKRKPHGMTAEPSSSQASDASEEPSRTATDDASAGDEPSPSSTNDGSAEPEVIPAEEPKADPGAVAAIAQHFGRLGVTGRDERLMWTGLIAGVPQLASSRDLTRAEAARVEKVLGRLRDRQALEAWGAEHDQQQEEGAS